MSLKKDMQTYFKTADLYDLFAIDKKASSEDVKKAYRKISLLVHPDRAPQEEKARATAKFQVIGKAYSILSDEKSRKLYDASGDVDDLVSDGEKDWADYFRSVFKEFGVEDIDAYEKEYIGSEEEKDDLKKNYEKCKGDMNLLMEYQIFYQFDREDIYRDIIREAIKNNEAKVHKKFFNESKASIESRRKKLEAEAKAAEKAKKKMVNKKRGGGDADFAALAARIRGNQEDRAKTFAGVVDKLEATSSTKNSKPKSKSRVKPIDEESENEGEWEGVDGDEIGKDDVLVNEADADKPTTSRDGGAKSKNGTQGKVISSAASKRRISTANGPKEGLKRGPKSKPPTVKRHRPI